VRFGGPRLLHRLDRRLVLQLPISPGDGLRGQLRLPQLAGLLDDLPSVSNVLRPKNAKNDSGEKDLSHPAQGKRLNAANTSLAFALVFHGSAGFHQGHGRRRIGLGHGPEKREEIRSALPEWVVATESKFTSELKERQ
jgi:hypothetical protein